MIDPISQPLLGAYQMTVLQKTQVKPTWKPEQMQELYTQMMASSFTSAMTVLCKHGEEATKEFQTLSRKPMIEYYKKLGVKTPIEIIKAKAELETNIFGSVIEFWGDDKEAHLLYNKCSMWEAMKKMGGMSCAQEEKMMQGFESCVKEFAQEFDCKGEVKMEGEKAIITIRK
jgi:hypothetical protein